MTPLSHCGTLKVNKDLQSDQVDGTPTSRQPTPVQPQSGQSDPVEERQNMVKGNGISHFYVLEASR
jgi:hypothetical protein